MGLVHSQPEEDTMRIPELQSQFLQDYAVFVNNSNLAERLEKLFGRLAHPLLEVIPATEPMKIHIMGLEGGEMQVAATCDDQDTIFDLQKLPQEHFAPPATIFILHERFVIKREEIPWFDLSSVTGGYREKMSVTTDLAFAARHWLTPPLEDLRETLVQLERFQQALENLSLHPAA
jgi:hypothetical protein